MSKSLGSVPMKIGIRAIVFTTLLILLSSCTFLGNKTPPPLPAIPQYPGAQQVKWGDIQSDSYNSKQDSSFETSDSAEDVLSFYDNALTGEGWHIGQEKLPNKHIYTAIIGGCQLTTVVISTSKVTPAKTSVQLSLSSQYCD